MMVSPLVNKIRTVALVEWNWMGHHPGYFKLYIRALLELGRTVVALCPKPGEVESALQDLPAEAKSRLSLRSIGWVSAPRGCPPRYRRHVLAMRSLYRVRKCLREWEKTQGKPVDLVFFACIYDSQFRMFPQAEWLFPWRWSGLYLHCRSFRKPGSPIPQSGELPCPELIFRSRKLHSIAILDEGAKVALENLSGRPVVVFPDLTDEAVPAEESPLAAKIKRFAAGAPIVAALGHLQHTKGVTTLARLAHDPANRDLCFAFIGEVQWALFNPQDRILISSLMDRCPNAFTHFAHIEEEPLFNSALQACDLLFAAYIDFPNSSGILTKAAVFQKPIIVSDGYLMAERVRKYSLGEVVPEHDVEATLRAIRKITSDKNSWLGANRPQWQAYREQHSYPGFKAAFENLLNAA